METGGDRDGSAAEPYHLGVCDVSRAQAFYEALGWRVDEGVHDETDHVAFFQAGGLMLALLDRGKLAHDSGRRLGRRDAGAQCPLTRGGRRRARPGPGRGGTIVRPGAATFWGGYSGVFIEPDGLPWGSRKTPVGPCTTTAEQTLA